MSVCEKLVIADAFVVSNILKPQERRPMMMYKIDDFSDFLNEVSSNSTLAKTLEGFSKLYREADNRGYRILPDKFGGFGLFNVTGKLLKPKCEPLEDIVGIIEEIPDSLKEKLSPLSIMKSSFTEKELVLLGVTRFVNHSCYPNTRFFQGYSCNYLPYKALRLQVIRSIKPGEEITVDYGDSFFGSFGECKCDYCAEKHSSRIEPDASNQEGKFFASCENRSEFEGPSSDNSPEGTHVSSPTEKQSKIGTPLLFSHLTENETSSDDSDVGNALAESVGTFSEKDTVGEISVNSKAIYRKRRLGRQHKGSVKVHRSSKTDPVEVIDGFIEQTASFSGQIDDEQPFLSDYDPVPISDQVISSSVAARGYSFFTTDDQSETSSERSPDRMPLVSSSSFPQLNFPENILCGNSNVTVHNALISLLTLVAKHGGSDELLYDLIKREQFIHPNSGFPTPFSVKTLIPELSNNYTKSHTCYDNGELICLHFFEHLRSVVEKNHEHILRYSSTREQYKDLNLEPVLEGDCMRLRLIVNTDGAIVRDSANESAYPVWVALADLPPILRSKYENIVFCSVWYGSGDLPWDDIFKSYQQEISRKFTVNA